MIKVENTKNNLGVAILGDFNDFEQLYDSLHEIVGDEGKYEDYEASRIRVLGLCYDLRHAMQGNREFEFVHNGLNPQIMKMRGIIAPENNLYLKINILWPEMLYIQMVLNNFVTKYAEGQSKEYLEKLLDKNNIWDEAIATIRNFQAAVNKAIKDTVTEATYSRMLGTMNKKYQSFWGYVSQYIDVLNIKFCEMQPEKRLKNISIMAKRIAEKGDEYRNFERDFKSAAKEYGCSVMDLRLNMEYPDELDW